ncbi:MAG: hypothetical protein Q8L68_00505 [Methylococcales bacterium]|nr:hypothetical protein [Methylococcales bacterium]
MSHYLLFLQVDQTGYAVELLDGILNENNGKSLKVIAFGASESHFDIRLQPDNNDDLYRSAEVGGQQAYQMLWREGYVRQSATARFHLDQAISNVQGHSADLLFALAVITTALPRAQKLFPSFAATGMLDEKGFVQGVEGIPAKLRAALLVIKAGGIIFFPRANETEINDELRQLAATQSIELCPIERLDQAVAKLGVVIRKTYLKEPYRGLETFEAEHRGIYFGRQADIEKLREKLVTRETHKKPGVLIVAASGAGKSSLIQAGLIPAIEEGSLALQDRPIFWSVWRPRDAIEGYDEAALVQAIQANWKKRRELSALAHADSLVNLAEQLAIVLSPERRFFWLVDQMEELFTLDFTNETVRSFSEFLRRLQEIGVWVVGTLRSDFYDRYQQQSALLDVFGTYGMYDLPALDAAALDQIIKCPAELADLSFETDNTGVSLAMRLQKDVAGRIDALPLLGFVLKGLYNARDYSGQMTYRSYDAMGGLLGAIGQRTEDVYKNTGLDNSAPLALRQLLWKLTVKEGNKQHIAAQAVNLNDFPLDDPMLSLIDAFTQERLLVRDDKGNNHTTRVRVAHEALLTHWDRAKVIVEDFIIDKQLHDRLKDQVDDWKNEGHLLPTEKLDKAEDLLERMRPFLDSDVIELIEASTQENKKSRLMEKKRKQRNIAMLIILFLVTVFFVAKTIEIIDEEQRLDVVGDWEYLIINKDKLITHGGTGTITSNGGENLIIKGYRKYVCVKMKDKITGKDLDECNPNGKLESIHPIDWGTNITDQKGIDPFALRIKGENVVHFVYYIVRDKFIDNDNKYIQAYCYLTPSDINIKEAPIKSFDRLSYNDNKLNSLINHLRNLLNLKDRPDVLEGNYTALAPDKLQGHLFFIRTEKEKLDAVISQRVNESGKKL